VNTFPSWKDCDLWFHYGILWFSQGAIKETRGFKKKPEDSSASGTAAV
jgi:hypothetical protein